MDFIALFRSYASSLKIDISTLQDQDIQNLINLANATLIYPVTNNGTCQVDPNVLGVAVALSAIYVFARSKPEIASNLLTTGSVNSISRSLPTGESLSISYSQTNSTRTTTNSTQGFNTITGLPYLDFLLDNIQKSCSIFFEDYTLPVQLENTEGLLNVHLFETYENYY